MLNGALEVYQVDHERGLLEGEILLDPPYEMTSILVNIFGTMIYVTPFDITQFRIVEDKLGISFSVIINLQAINQIINAIAMRN